MVERRRMSVLAVSVGTPREVQWHGRAVRTSIYKQPVSGRVRVARLNIDGDSQSDLSVHGGPEKAVYAYPAEHYAAWMGELPGVELAWGAFGENLTIEGLLEDQVRIGDRYRIGTAELVATQPRTPCYKLGVRFGRAEMVKRLHDSGRSGFYFAVAREGALAAGDPIELLERDERGLTVADVLGLYALESPDRALLERASRHAALPDRWRDHFRKRLSTSGG
jgi:MOSC domain-containing protein YiiM